VVITYHQNHKGVDRAGFGCLGDYLEKPGLDKGPISSGLESRVWIGGHELPLAFARGNSCPSPLKYKNV
jgi:hypothetical protein